jgi:PAS domain S-box-containing protein
VQDELFRAVCENATDVIYTFDLSGRITWVNAAAERLTGYKRDELLGMDVNRLIAPDRLAASLQMFDRKVVEGGRTVFELVLIDKMGRRLTAEVNSQLIYRDGKPAGVQGIARDITERKRADEERRALEAQVQQLQKLESLGVLAGGIAHEFNNILTGILCRADLALMELPPDHRGCEHLEQIVVGARRAAVLTAQMLAYSGAGRFAVRQFDLSELVRNVTGRPEMTAAHNATLRLDLEANLPRVAGDDWQLRQVCISLVTNAVEALGEAGGEVRVGTGTRHCDRAFLATCHLGEALPEGEYVFVEVADTGCGMSPEVQARMFDPFFSTKFVGRGLGLAAVLGIVRGHQGTMKIRTTLGVGTTVQVLFPLASPVEERGTADG